MNDFKFRAWDGERMHGPFALRDLVGDCYGEITILGTDIHLEHYSQEAWDDYVLMQYTGVADSDGIEIYEGDVLEMVSQFARNKGEVKERGPVEFRHGMFHIRSDTGHSPRVGGAAGFTYHVIGNIYEDAELLEECDGS